MNELLRKVLLEKIDSGKPEDAEFVKRTVGDYLSLLRREEFRPDIEQPIFEVEGLPAYRSDFEAEDVDPRHRVRARLLSLLPRKR